MRNTIGSLTSNATNGVERGISQSLWFYSIRKFDIKRQQVWYSTSTSTHSVVDKDFSFLSIKRNLKLNTSVYMNAFVDIINVSVSEQCPGMLPVYTLVDQIVNRVLLSYGKACDIEKEKCQ